MHRRFALFKSLNNGDNCYCSLNKEISLIFSHCLFLCLNSSLVVSCLIFSGYNTDESHSEGNSALGIDFVSKLVKENMDFGGFLSVQFGQEYFSSLVTPHLSWSEEAPGMDNRDIMEYRRILRRHEESIPVLQTSALTKYRQDPKTKISATSGKISENAVRMKNNVVRMKISENIADPDFEDNITNITILSRCW
jgi:hypothetical protein